MQRASARELFDAADAVLLDALGTLVALEPPAPLLRDELGQRFGIEVSLPQAEAAIAAEIEYYRMHLDEGRDARSLAALRARCAEVVGAALALPDRLEVPEITEALLASLNFTPFDDVVPMLRAARAAGRRLVVVSNWDASLPDVLDRLGLAPLLDGVVTSARAGARKPAPAIFEQALAIADVAASRAIHVGDSLEEDVAGARAAGVEPVLLRRKPPAGPPGVTAIASLADLAGA